MYILSNSHEVLQNLNNMKKLGILNNLDKLHRKIKKFKNILDVCTTLDQSFLFWPHKFFCWRKWLLKLPEFLLSDQEVQMYESYFLQEKNAFPKRKIHPIYQSLWVYFRIQCNFCSQLCLHYIFYILRGFSVQYLPPKYNFFRQND